MNRKIALWFLVIAILIACVGELLALQTQSTLALPPIHHVAASWKTYQDKRYWFQVNYLGSSPPVTGTSFYSQSPNASGTPVTIGSHTWLKITDNAYILFENGERIRIDLSSPDPQYAERVLSTFEFITFPGQQRLDKTILSLKDGDTINNLKVVGNGSMSFDSVNMNGDVGGVNFSGQLILTGQYSLDGMTLEDAITFFTLDATSSKRLPQFDFVDTFPTYFQFRNADFAKKIFGDYRGSATVLVDNLTETVTPQWQSFSANLIKIISKP